jgi:16S rRNA (guanine966-N2)-methyltransferase
VLDLFAGTGALAIEAMSRGARRAVVVERHRPALDVVRANLAATGLADEVDVVRSSAEDYLTATASEHPDTRFDLVLLDPPYGFEGWPALFEAVEGVVSPDTFVVIESDREIPVPGTWRVERRKAYGSTFVAIARPPEPHRPSQPESR